MTDSLQMRALIVDVANGPLRLVSIPRPVPGPGQVLVRIKASGVNPLDGKIRSGQAAHARQPLPAVLGMDLAGTIEALGEGVSGWLPGDEVYAMATGIGGAQGSLAQFAVVDARLLAHKPGNLSMRETAGLPLVLITAWEGLVDRARVRAGQKVLIHGGAGGVGHVAVQIARAFGAEVFATGSAGQQAIIESFGATFIDYRKSSVEDYVAEHTGGEGFDIVYDTVGGETLDASFKAARVYEGHVVSCLGWGQHSLAPLSFRAATYSGVFTLLPLLTGKGGEHHGQILRDAAKLIEAGKLKPLLDPRQFTLQTAEAAHELLAGGAAQGRLVIEI
ncbi:MULTISPECIES: zinc-dependent alcohol dehydrogenase family protein [Pseudomonas]|jgi:NADPH:quinone reductase-like Zn-dependent oxidoreductase|uniref:Zinc-dependent alcohol dehydrogenase family protein n=1 Tax=Pseudomonas mandelii TaxID=75612 RepID=A0AB36D7P2_9PSED|nr:MULTISPECIES: zinc-dependent alcohol dehydrogenase family protein [Pseudomonas]MBU0521237.1 zinc-dependent alcohol dehydrogenase family protein [Gammaproteobacteria bacterium]MDF9882111.1 NADPH:quinone reductase-like Zn-dependent oxidoreductase [Pseudomonas silensiensis]MBA4362540.1 quinone oxidoreductase [Pseudomonas sp.]MBU0820677.1 zinc-dependent alcohol dehydrogenase family protein [Gammaproteobacteria bacterium]MBU0844193.1 zinc-dependent alcohol dehydrogenase family protein [Gammaprot